MKGNNQKIKEAKQTQDNNKNQKQENKQINTQKTLIFLIGEK
jgi:hypothetical protein